MSDPRLQLPDARSGGAVDEHSPGTLKPLRWLAVGDGLEGLHLDGSVQRFVVTDVAPASTSWAEPEGSSSASAPAGDRDRVVLDADGGTLRIEICGGPYDPHLGAYRDTVVLTLRAEG